MNYEIELNFPEWLITKLEKNERALNELQFKAVNYYYKQITNTKLKRGCPDCISDAFIILNLYLKHNQ